MNTDNRLIAEFMGCEHVSGVLYEGYKGITINGLDVVPVYSGENLSYHKSWDWLMPVVEKIQKMEYSVVIAGRLGYIRKGLGYSCEFLHWDGDIDIIQYNETPLKATYNAVVEFIKWYNQNNKTNEH